MTAIALIVVTIALVAMAIALIVTTIALIAMAIALIVVTIALIALAIAPPESARERNLVTNHVRGRLKFARVSAVK